MLEFDNVLDKQRRAVYERRRTIVVGTKEEIAGVIGELAGESTEAKVLLTKKEEELGAEQFFAAARGILLQGLDLLWVEHLESMEYLRGSVNLRAYGQRDPLTEYRREGTRIYKEMEEVFRGNVFEMLERLTKDRQPSGVAAPAPVITLSAPPEGGSEIGRNDPCPCSSGKKWKNCGLKNTEEHQRLMEAKK